MNTHLKKLFTFRGHVGRRYFGFWWLGCFVLLSLGLPLLLSGLRTSSTVINDQQLLVESVVMYSIILGLVISGFSVVVRRARDAGYDGIRMLILFVPVVNAVFVIMLFFLASETEKERKERLGDTYRPPEERKGNVQYTSRKELKRRAGEAKSE